MSDDCKNILAYIEDVEECLNDTWLHAWNSIPPQWPACLSAYLGRITRNLSFNRYKREHRQKRGGNEITLVLDELAECVSGQEDIEGLIDEQELKKEIQHYISGLSREKRDQFYCRYWYAMPICDIASRHEISEGKVFSNLNRIRKGLKKHLNERGYWI